MSDIRFPPVVYTSLDYKELADQYLEKFIAQRAEIKELVHKYDVFGEKYDALDYVYKDLLAKNSETLVENQQLKAKLGRLLDDYNTLVDKYHNAICCRELDRQKYQEIVSLEYEEADK